MQVIIPNLNRRFSGITSTVTALIPHQAREMEMAAIGYPLPSDVRHLGLREFLRLTRSPLLNGRPRVFHARRNIEMLFGLLAKHLFRCKLHLIFTSTAQRRHTRWTRFLYHQMDTLLATSPRAASYLERFPSAIVPHGVDGDIYRPAQNRANAWKQGGLPGRFGIGIFGRLRPQKGLAEFVSALCRVLPDYPDYTAVIIGETTPKFSGFVEEQKRKITSSGLEERFCWLGKLPFGEIPIWFRRMSLVACVPRNEGFGLTCLEAMASGVPVVATLTGAFEMLVRDGVDGVLTPCGDVDALAAAFENLIQNPVQLEAMGRAARQRVCNAFTIEHEAGALNEIYKKILIVTNVGDSPERASHTRD